MRNEIWEKERKLLFSFLPYPNILPRYLNHLHDRPLTVPKKISNWKTRHGFALFLCVFILCCNFSILLTRLNFWYNKLKIAKEYHFFHSLSLSTHFIFIFPSPVVQISILIFYYYYWITIILIIVNRSIANLKISSENQPPDPKGLFLFESSLFYLWFAYQPSNEQKKKQNWKTITIIIGCVWCDCCWLAGCPISTPLFLSFLNISSIFEYYFVFYLDIDWIKLLLIWK